MRSNRLRLLVSALISIVISVLLFFFLQWASAHRYDDGFDWVSSAVMQPIALLMLAAFVVGLVLVVAGLVQKPAK